jgi:hypothetical protein
MKRKTNPRSARQKGRSIAPPTRNKHVAPRSAEQYFAKPPRFREVWNRITQVITKMRSHKISLQQASLELGVDPRTVVRHCAAALRKSANGRFAAKSSDRLLRVLVIPSHVGTREIAVRGSRPASQLAKYWAGVQKYLQTGNTSGVKGFRGTKIVDANGHQISLITDLRKLDRLGSAGIFSFESIYARVA